MAKDFTHSRKLEFIFVYLSHTLTKDQLTEVSAGKKKNQ